MNAANHQIAGVNVSGSTRSKLAAAVPPGFVVAASGLLVPADLAPSPARNDVSIFDADGEPIDRPTPAASNGATEEAYATEWAQSEQQPNWNAGAAGSASLVANGAASSPALTRNEGGSLRPSRGPTHVLRSAEGREIPLSPVGSSGTSGPPTTAGAPDLALAGPVASAALVGLTLPVGPAATRGGETAKPPAPPYRRRRYLVDALTEPGGQTMMVLRDAATQKVISIKRVRRRRDRQIMRRVIALAILVGVILAMWGGVSLAPMVARASGGA